APRPVELLAVHVDGIDPPPRPGPGDPEAERLLTQLTRAVEVTRAASHREPLAQHGLGDWQELAVARLLRQANRLFGGDNRLVSLLGPLQGPCVAEIAFDLVPSPEVGQQLGQVVDCRRVVSQSRAGEAAGEADAVALLIVP